MKLPQPFFYLTFFFFFCFFTVLSYSQTLPDTAISGGESPPPVLGVTGIDTPNDFGGQVTLTWRDPPAIGFDHYRIYLSPLPITGTAGLRPILTLPHPNLTNVDVPTPSDGIDYYLAVTAVDASENESVLEASSVIGPIQSRNNIGAGTDAPVQIVSGPVGLVRQKSVTFHFSAFVNQLPLFAYSLDESPFQFTSVNQVTFYSLREGDHTFSVRLAEGDAGTTTRTFSVLPTFTIEVEPNDAPAFANPLTTHAIMRGFNAADSDEDWYRIDRVDALFPASAGGQGRVQIDLHIERPAGIGRAIVSVFDLDTPQESAMLSEIQANPSGRQRAQLSLGFNERTNGLLVRVQSERENPGAGYELSLGLTRRDERSILEVEHNDTPNFATPVFLPTPPVRVGEASEIVGRADRSEDVDWYRLNIDSEVPRLLQMVLSALSEPRLKVYAGTRISLETQIGQLELTPWNPEPIHLETVVTRGTYLLSIENNQMADLQSESRYRLQLQLRDIPAGIMWEIEPNGGRAGATPITIDSQIRGTSWHPSNDLDWFRLSIDRRGILNVGLHLVGEPDNLPEIEMRLTDIRGNEVAPAVSLRGQTDSVPTISANVVPGAYFIELEPQAGQAASMPAGYILTPLQINNASHNAVDEILGLDSELVVTLDWIAGRSAAFRIEPTEIRVAMVDEGNGTYVGRYPVPPDRQIDDGEIVIDLSDGQVLLSPNQIRLKAPVIIDTLPPEITQVQHDAIQSNGEIKPIGMGQTVRIHLTGEAVGRGQFRIGVPTQSQGTSMYLVIGDLFDDGEHHDGDANDGSYGGSYTVRLGDNVTGATLIGLLEDRAGNVAEFAARRTIALDTEPPEIQGLTFTVTRQGALIQMPADAQIVTLLAGDLLTVTLEGEAGGREAEFDLGEIQTGIPLFDDGTRGDRQSSDGLYTAAYIVRKSDSATNAVIIGRLRDQANNENEMASPMLIDVDTSPPEINTIEHNGTNRPFVAGTQLIVHLNGEPGSTATFNIGNFKTGLVMVDDGSGVDEQAGDGSYSGVYEVLTGDNASEAVITGQLVDMGGNQSVVRAATRVTIDAVPPNPIREVSVVDQPNDQGNALVVTWAATSTTLDFVRYHIYREAAPIRSTFGLIPISPNLVVQEQTIATVTVPRNNFDYYIAVTAVDQAGNESSLILEGVSVSGPVRALDNIAPPSIVDVKAVDKPDDNGKTIIVSWAPIRTNEATTGATPSEGETVEGNDFARYQIYVDSQSIGDVEDLTPQLALADSNATEAEVSVRADHTDFYVAVTAVDENGNESVLDLASNGSTFGPVQSLDEIPPDPVLNVVAIDTPSDQGSSLAVGWTPQIGSGVNRYHIHLSPSPIGSAEDLDGIDPVGIDGEATDLISISTPADGVDFYVAVTAVDFSENSSTLSPEGLSVDGPIQSVSNTIRSAARTTITAGFEPRTKIILPPNAARDGQTVDIFLPSDEALLALIDEANHFLAEAHIDEQIDFEFQDTAREFVLTGGEKLAVPAELTLSYPAVTQTQLPPEGENDLRIFRLNVGGRVALWELLPGVQTVNREDKTVAGLVEKLTVFRIARLQLPNDLKNVIVFPNPFIPQQSESKRVTFLNPTANATIEIYTLNGQRVRSITVENSTGLATWDGTSDGGREVASGLYIYLIRSDADKAVGRIMVMR